MLIYNLLRLQQTKNRYTYIPFDVYNGEKSKRTSEDNSVLSFGPLGLELTERKCSIIYLSVH